MVAIHFTGNLSYELRIPFVAEPVWVRGTSMTNTLQDGEIVLVSKMAYGKDTDGMERGDVVICRYPGRMEKSFRSG